jgi:hypothetical protein
LQHEWTVDDVMRFIDNTCRVKFGHERTEHYKRLVFENDVDGEVSRVAGKKRAVGESGCWRVPACMYSAPSLRAAMGGFFGESMTAHLRPRRRMRADHGGNDGRAAPEAGHRKFRAPPPDFEADSDVTRRGRARARARGGVTIFFSIINNACHGAGHRA